MTYHPMRYESLLAEMARNRADVLYRRLLDDDGMVEDRAAQLGDVIRGAKTPETRLEFLSALEGITARIRRTLVEYNDVTQPLREGGRACRDDS